MKCRATMKVESTQDPSTRFEFVCYREDDHAGAHRSIGEIWNLIRATTFEIEVTW